MQENTLQHTWNENEVKRVFPQQQRSAKLSKVDYVYNVNPLWEVLLK